MISLYIGSTDRHAGKSLIAFGLGKMAQKKGLRLAYLKPLGTNPMAAEEIIVDGDALFIARALSLDEPLSLLSPVVPTKEPLEWMEREDINGLMSRVADAHERLSKNRDLIIIGGAGDLIEGKLLGLDGPSVVSHLKAAAILVMPYQDKMGLDHIMAARQWLGERLLGVVLNRVPHSRIDHFGGLIGTFLEKQGLTLFGILPKDDILDSVSVGEMASHLRGDLIIGQEFKENLVERISVGAMNVDSALKYFRRSKNKAVITGGDRADIQLAALETSTRCLILTGGLYPNEIILSRAREAGVPIMVVKKDTFNTVEAVEEILGKLHPRESQKLDRAIELIESNIDFERLLKAVKNKR